MLKIMSSDIRDFRHDSQIIQKRDIDEKYEAVNAYEHLALIIDIDQSMK